jgi:hypothetical protein
MRYAIYFVDAEDIDINADDFGYDTVREAARDYWLGNDTYELSTQLIRAINADEVNTENGYIFLTDQLQGIVLS